MRRILLLFLSAFMIFSVSIESVMPASAESISVKKIISVVYDDSGSMKGDKWAYANYAMQAFCGMLNSEDQLYLTYMSRSKQNGYSPQRVDLTADGIQRSVDTIRNHSEDATTPFSSVTKAFNKLASVQDTDKNTQYWLVVITDGDFDECNYWKKEDKKQYVNDKLQSFSGQVMPNGTYPQITFMAIGDEVILPDEDPYKGIYTYTAENADQITQTMSTMADRISSRTRLQSGEVKQVDEKTIQVSSTIPLSNIAVLLQDSSTKVTSARNGKKNIPISRQVSLGYPGYEDLTGGAYLLGESGKSLSSGTYEIAFDQSVSAQNVVILFEPALETRIIVSTGDKKITDLRDLETVPAGEVVSVSFKIYELGTDNEISDSSLPAGTKFQLAVSEEGQTVKESSGKEKAFSGYSLKNKETEFSSYVVIQGFNPIGQAIKLHPGKKATYTLTPEFGGKTKNVHYNSISQNKNMTVCFSLSADGKRITNPEVIKSFNPQFSLSPAGNDGTMSISADGKIVFTPNASSSLTQDDDNLEVSLTCILNNGTKATETYTVVVADYGVEPVGEAVSIRKTEFFENKKGVSFYITKNGSRMQKSAVENKVSAVLDDLYQHLLVDVTIADDGKVTVVPYTEEKRKLSFFSWWSNWYHYFKLPGKDMTVTLMHTLASGSGIINITEAPLSYQILNVYLPLLIELIVLGFILWCIYRYITKPRFASNAVLYIGSVDRSRSKDNRGHFMDLRAVHLKNFNKFKFLYNPFKELKIRVGGIYFTAAKKGKIICHAAQPWYLGDVQPVSSFVTIEYPEDVVTYCEDNGELLINEIPTISVLNDPCRLLSQDDTSYYLVDADVNFVSLGNQRLEVIDSAIIFCYSTN